MKWNFWKWGLGRNCGLLVLAIWLILVGLSGWPFQLHFRYEGGLQSVLALVAGILLLLRR
ncbi:MAG: hypothetical protein JO112_17500 [Planctomycetes bacterium]|nr:hypothetical protein [Planctomycetota bacterium]